MFGDGITTPPASTLHPRLTFRDRLRAEGDGTGSIWLKQLLGRTGSPRPRGCRLNGLCGRRSPTIATRGFEGLAAPRGIAKPSQADPTG